MSDLLASVPRAAQRSATGTQGAALAPALAWALAAGAPIAARSHALELHDGVLRVEIDAGDAGVVLRRQIESVAAELRAALNAILGPQQVQRLEFTILTAHA